VLIDDVVLKTPAGIVVDGTVRLLKGDGIYIIDVQGNHINDQGYFEVRSLEKLKAGLFDLQMYTKLPPGLRRFRHLGNGEVELKFLAGNTALINLDVLLDALSELKRASTLSSLYPDMAAIVANIVGSSKGNNWSFCFTLKENRNKKFLRYKGILDDHVLDRIREIYEIQDNIDFVKRGKWMELSGKLNAWDFAFTGDDGTEPIPFRNHEPYSRKRFDCFVNDRLVYEVDLVPSDIVVFVERNLKQESIDRTKSPILSVYQAPTTFGPFLHPEMIGKTALSITKSKKLRRFLELEKGDAVLCYICEKPNCNDEPLEVGEEIHVQKAQEGDGNIFTIQTNMLIGSASLELAELGGAILGRDLNMRHIPDEVEDIVVNDDPTALLCNTQLKNGDVVKVYLK